MHTEIIIELIKTGKVYFRDLDNNIYNFKEINGFDAHCSSEIASVTLKNKRKIFVSKKTHNFLLRCIDDRIKVKLLEAFFNLADKYYKKEEN